MLNDSDPDGDPIPRLDLVTLPQHGNLASSFTIDRRLYFPAAGFNGSDNFSYKICDDLGACSTPATVTLQVGAQPTPTPTPPPPPPSPTPTPTPVEPLIFIPGISGSKLNERLADGTSRNLWPGVTNVIPPVVADKAPLTLDPTLPHADIFAPDVIRATPIRLLLKQIGEEPVYKPMLEMLAGNGYREYQVKNDPNRRTVEGCDVSQKTDDPATNPNLFVFAYDWRKSNIENAALLKSYVGCVQKFYPDSRVNILTHSMGGLMARRYILDNPGRHSVGELITIGAPWLGAPKAINVLETGQFDLPQMVISRDVLKRLIEFFKSAHEIMPSRSYFTIDGNVFGEKDWDLNGDRRFTSSYNYNQILNLLDNVSFPRSKPGTSNKLFHDNPGQDDWNLDNSGIRYFHLYGVKHLRDTVGKLTAVAKPVCDAAGKCKQNLDFEKSYVKGDGTVPEISATRISGATNLNAKNAILKPFTGRSADAGHVQLTQNPQVWAEVLSILSAGRAPQAAQNSPRAESRRAHHRRKALGITGTAWPADDSIDEPGYYVTVGGVNQVIVTDSEGNNNEPIPDSPFGATLPDVTYDLGLNSVSIVTATDQNYTLEFASKGEPITVQALKGVGTEVPTQAIRYLDLNLPAGIRARLTLYANGIGDLVCDADGDGIFESTVIPTASVIGPNALDVEPPAIVFSEDAQSGLRTVTIGAADNQSGIRMIRYSLDGETYQPYAAPINVAACQVGTIYAFADDNVGNRSMLSSYELSNLPPNVTNARASITTLWPPNHKMAQVSIFGVDDPDCDPVSISITRITQDEPTDSIGDGSTCPDAIAVGSDTTQLRSERNGGGNGRVYTIYFSASDGKGGLSQGNVKVSVPRSLGRNAVEDTTAFDSMICGSVQNGPP
jgi:pimeloyl-ACP methyl ester carboxylesterase